MASGFKSAADIGLGKDGNSILVPDMQAGMLYQLPITIPGAEVNQQPLAVDSLPAFANIQWEGWSPETDSGKPNQFRPIVLTHAGDGSNRIFLATEHGVIYVFENKDDVKTAKVFADLRDRVVYNDKQNEEGFLGLAFHPQFKDNGEVFVFYTTKHEKLTNIVSRFKVNKQHPELLDPTSEQVLIKYQKPFWNHDGGSLCFGPTAISTSCMAMVDQATIPLTMHRTWALGWARFSASISTHMTKARTMLSQGQSIRGTTGALPEIWAYGFRNVWRMHFDRQTVNCGPLMLVKTCGKRSTLSNVVATMAGIVAKAVIPLVPRVKPRRTNSASQSGSIIMIWVSPLRVGWSIVEKMSPRSRVSTCMLITSRAKSGR